MNMQHLPAEVYNNSNCITLLCIIIILGYGYVTIQFACGEGDRASFYNVFQFILKN
jgi:hypothetical protein